MKTKTCQTCRGANESYVEYQDAKCGACVSQSTNGSQMTGWVQSPSYETEDESNE